jgi:ABC-type Mn2+/Zn2+ transport system ATPase subunit
MTVPGRDGVRADGHGVLARLDGVTCDYGGEPVVVDASLTVGHDDYVGIVGPSGSGKTTLLRALLGTLRPRSGTVTRAPGLRVGYVPQTETVDWSFPVTVAEAVLMARPRPPGRWVPWASRDERAEVAAMLDRLGIGELGRRHIRDLSGGQQQRVFIARALLRQPQLLVMDEPTSGVDVRTRHELLHLLAELRDGGLAIVLTTHDLNGLAAHLPRLVCLQREVVAAGTPLEVLTPAVLQATYGAPMEVLVHGGMPVVVDPVLDRAPEPHGTKPDPAARPGPGLDGPPLPSELVEP